MANFETHLPLGIASGILLAAAGLHAHQIQPVEGVAVIALATIGGCLPDIDQKNSRPSKFLNQFLCFVMPILLLLHFKPKIGYELWVNLIFYILFCAISYYIICPSISKMTKHRGVMHTIPFAVLCGELTYLLFVSDYEFLNGASEKMPVYFGMAMFIGCITHLVVDEFYSLYDEKEKKFKKKWTFGSAMTMYSEISTPQANVAVYVLATLAAFAINNQRISLQSLVQMFIDSN